MTKEEPQDSQSSQSSSPPRSRSRPGDLDIFTTDEIENPLPSPPYRRVPSSSHVLLEDIPERSPAYRSRSNLDLSSTMLDHSPPDKKHSDSDDDRERAAPDTKYKRTVHYPEGVQSPVTATSRPFLARFDSDFEGATGSRTPSIAGTETDDEMDDYDWSGEDDLVDEEARFEEKMGVTRKESSWGLKRFITMLFSSLIGSTFLSGIIITPALLVHFFWYKPHPTDHRRFVKDNVEAWLFWAAANLTISWYLAFLVDIIPALIRYFVSLTWGHVSEAIKGKLELYTSVKDNIKPLFYAASAWVSWVILFDVIYGLHNQDDPDLSRASYTPRVFDAVEFVFFFTLVICAQKMLSRAVAFSFHRIAYRERLEALTEALDTIEKLRMYRPKRHAPKSSFGFGRSTPVLSALVSPFTDSRPGSRAGSRPGSRAASPIRSRPATPERLREVMSDAEELDATLVKKGKGKQRKSWLGRNVESEPETTTKPQHDHTYPPSAAVSPIRSGAQTPARRAGDSDAEEPAMLHQAATQAAKAIKSAVLHDARNISGKEDDELGNLVFNVTSSREAKRLAKAIYMAFKNRHRRSLLPSDFYPAFKSHEEAEKAFRVFDKDNNGDLSKAELKSTLVRVYKERRLLSRSMRDVGQALKTLDRILLFFAMVILLFISLSVFNVGVGDALTSLYSLGIAASFIFKNSASNAFDAIMFLFVTHPFDTGDRCFIDEENLVVKKMGLFATVFARADGTETYYSNSMLFTKFITNARRSAHTWENLTMQIAWRTPLEKLDKLEQCLNGWLSTEQNRWFEPSTSIVLQKISYQRHLEITIGIGHNGNWHTLTGPEQDWGTRLARKTAFHTAVNYYCRQLGIIAYEAPLPVAWADPETMDYRPLSPLPYDEDESPLVEGEIEIPSPQLTQQRRPSVVLGFQPPSDTPVPGLRARKSRSRKAMGSMGADG